MDIKDYNIQDNKIQAIEHIIAQAKSKNESNPAVLTRDDEYVESHIHTALTKPAQ